MIRPVPGVAFGTVDDGDPRGDPLVRADLSASLEIPSEWAWVRQVHSNTVVAPAGAGVHGPGDALVTTDASLPVAVSVADCLPVAIMADGAVGIAHAGWRGAAAGIVAATVSALTKMGHPPHTAVVGPGIGPCCFEVGREVADRFAGSLSHTTWGTTSVDLSKTVGEDLADLEVHVIAACTHHEDRFHSFRRDGTAGRQFGVAWITAA